MCKVCVYCEIVSMCVMVCVYKCINVSNCTCVILSVCFCMCVSVRTSCLSRSCTPHFTRLSADVPMATPLGHPMRGGGWAGWGGGGGRDDDTVSERPDWSQTAAVKHMHTHSLTLVYTHTYTNSKHTDRKSVV